MATNPNKLHTKGRFQGISSQQVADRRLEYLNNLILSENIKEFKATFIDKQQYMIETKGLSHVRGLFGYCLYIAVKNQKWKIAEFIITNSPADPNWKETGDSESRILILAGNCPKGCNYFE